MVKDKGTKNREGKLYSLLPPHGNTKGGSKGGGSNKGGNNKGGSKGGRHK